MSRSARSSKETTSKTLSSGQETTSSPQLVLRVYLSGVFYPSMLRICKSLQNSDIQVNSYPGFYGFIGPRRAIYSLAKTLLTHRNLDVEFLSITKVIQSLDSSSRK